jgi:hypothetical protein
MKCIATIGYNSFYLEATAAEVGVFMSLCERMIQVSSYQMGYERKASKEDASPLVNFDIGMFKLITLKQQHEAKRAEEAKAAAEAALAADSAKLEEEEKE